MVYIKGGLFEKGGAAILKIKNCFLRTTGLFFYFLTALNLFSQASGDSIMFISSSPTGAGVKIDGTKIEGTTPLLLKKLVPGKHKIEIVKNGYDNYFTTVETSKKEIKYIKPKLNAITVSIEIHDEDTILLNGIEIKNTGTPLKLPSGKYDIYREDNILYIDPIYPKQKRINVLNVFVPTLFLLSGGLTIGELVDGNRKDNDKMSFFSPLTTITYSATLSLLITDIVLHKKKIKYLETYSVTVRSLGAGGDSANDHYQKAQEFLTLNKRDKALEYYKLIINDFSDSLLMPEALYKVAKIYKIEGKNKLAIAKLKLILREFPAPEVYDKACNMMAELQNSKEKKVFYLKKMVFYDPLFSKQEIQKEIKLLTETESDKGKGGALSTGKYGAEIDE